MRHRFQASFRWALIFSPAEDSVQTIQPALAWHAWLLMVDARFAAGERAAVLDHGADWSPLRIMMKP
jgi:hypothetical protein